MATYKDIAQLTGLSLATISKYFNGLPVRDRNRAAIDAAVAELGYRVNPAARSLRRGRSQSLGVVLPALDNAFHMSVVAELERILRREGIGLLVSASRPEEPGAAVEFLRDKGVDAVIAVPSAGEAEALSELAADGVVLVLLDREQDGVEAPVVELDNRAAGRMAARLLLDHGHRDVAVLGGPDDVSSLRGRTAGFVAECAGTGAEVRVRHTPLTVDDGAVAATSLLFGATRPTAIFAANYELTVGALRAVAEAGLAVPGDVSLVGLDGGELAGLLRPRLTTIVQPADELAASVAQQVMARLTDQAPPPVGLAGPRLLAGGTVGAPAG